MSQQAVTSRMQEFRFKESPFIIVLPRYRHVAFHVHNHSSTEPMVLGATRYDALEYVAEIGLRINPVELGRIKERSQNRPALGTTFATTEQ